jgi:hypothetical protein
VGVFAKPSNKTKYRLVQEEWTPKRSCKAIPKEAYAALGFHPNMSFEEADARAKQLNLQDKLDKKAIIAATARVKHQTEVASAYLPEWLVKPFMVELTEMYNDNSERLDTVLKHWTTAQKLIAELELDSKNFFAERIKILTFYKLQKWSPDYIKRINRILNLWGGFVSRKTNTFYQPLPKLSNNQTQKIVELREDKDDIRKAAPALKWNDLNNKKSTFEHAGLLSQWNWLFIGLWFGLRPKEIDNLVKQGHLEIKFDDTNKIHVLAVYQTKLTSLPKEKRWKHIPIYCDEQKTALEIIKTGNFKRPLNKTLKRIFSEPIETYSPRKGFTDLMLEKQFSLEDISTFLGHCDISTTWRHYKDKFTFKLPGLKAS